MFPGVSPGSSAKRLKSFDVVSTSIPLYRWPRGHRQPQRVMQHDLAQVTFIDAYSTHEQHWVNNRMITGRTGNAVKIMQFCFDIVTSLCVLTRSVIKKDVIIFTYLLLINTFVLFKGNSSLGIGGGPEKDRKCGVVDVLLSFSPDTPC